MLAGLFGWGKRTPPPEEPPPPKAMTLPEYAAIIEGVLLGLGQEPDKIRKMPDSTTYHWSFQYRSATVQLYLLELEGQRFLQAFAPIIHLPQSNLLALYRHLLEVNLKMTNAATGINHDIVYVFHERILDGLDAVEAQAIINGVAHYADKLDDELLKEFGGRRYMQV